MRLNSNDILFGQPILKIREIIRFAIREQLYGESEQQIILQVATALKQSSSIADGVFKSLVTEGYLVLHDQDFSGKTYYKVVTTEKGQRHGVSRANPPISRQKADLLLKELLQRVKRINGRKDHMYKVGVLKVFGSYLSKENLLSDVDVAYTFLNAFNPGEFSKGYRARVEIAIKKGRHFNSSQQMINWPRREVELMLRTKKKGLSLHNMYEDEIARNAIGLIIYEYSPKQV